MRECGYRFTGYLARGHYGRSGGPKLVVTMLRQSHSMNFISTLIVQYALNMYVKYSLYTLNMFLRVET